MALSTGNLVVLVFIFALVSMSHSYAITSQMEPIDRCIYTCIHCFKDNNVEVICANECLATEGKMHPFWIKSCPELNIPLFHFHGYDIENTFNPDAIENNLKK